LWHFVESAPSCIMVCHPHGTVGTIARLHFLCP
jgi:hypothetical protein